MRQEARRAAFQHRKTCPAGRASRSLCKKVLDTAATNTVSHRVALDPLGSKSREPLGQPPNHHAQVAVNRPRPAVPSFQLLDTLIQTHSMPQPMAERKHLRQAAATVAAPATRRRRSRPVLLLPLLAVLCLGAAAADGQQGAEEYVVVFKRGFDASKVKALCTQQAAGGGSSGRLHGLCRRRFSAVLNGFAGELLLSGWCTGLG